jgi:hypothetical protein
LAKTFDLWLTSLLLVRGFLENNVEIDEIAWKGVGNLLEDYARVQSGDAAVIAFSPECVEYAAWLHVALIQLKVQNQMLEMQPLFDETFGNRLEQTIKSLTLAKRLLLFTLESDTFSHDSIIRSTFNRTQFNDVTVIRCISVSHEFFSSGLAVSSEELSRRNATLLSRLYRAEKARVTTESGTDLQIGFNSEEFVWISNRGKCRPGHFIILPPGEIATYPASICGRLVADFAFNVNTSTEHDVRLERYPVTVFIDNGRAQDFSCDNRTIAEFVSSCFSRKNGNRVGEFGIGTNTAIKVPVMKNSHINERRLGIHVGFGQHNQRRILDYQCDVHLDLIARGGQIWIDDEQTSINLETLPQDEIPHMEGIREEDVFSIEEVVDNQDCCSTKLFCR